MRLDELLEGVEYLDLSNAYGDMEVVDITADSRQVHPGSVFVAIPGTRFDGHDYIEAALAAGATIVVQSRPLQPGGVGSFLRVADPRTVYSQLCPRLYGYPSRALRLIGVTGTNGKTSTTLIIRHLLNSAGLRCAALGTLGLLRHDGDGFESTGLTTPDAKLTQQLLKSCVDAGATHLVMEVSSHALDQGRVIGLEFAGGVFTNLSQDHFDYHGTVAAYLEAKALLFTYHLPLSGGYSVLNVDDPAGQEYARRAGGIKVLYGSGEKANLQINELHNAAGALSWDIELLNGVWSGRVPAGSTTQHLQTKLTGRYNAYNCTAAAAVALLEGLSLEQVGAGLASFSGVPGRLQGVENRAGVHVYVDYAHTPDALDNVLAALNEVRPQGARIITVFGCGGDRDNAKRPLMAKAAQAASDVVVVTSDNPRTEDPEKIIEQIMVGVDAGRPDPAVGVQAVYREVDRRAAIKLALSKARPGDIVLIAGKGHEDYQILGEEKIHFSDVEEAEAFFSDRGL